ncbi:MAG: hypothetical protein R3B70_42015 [Polyangiaceae bacterium]
MSTKKGTVRISRKSLAKLKRLAYWAVGPEIEIAREAAKTVRTRGGVKAWATQQGGSAFALKGETPQEIQAIQQRSAVRSAGVGALLAWLATTDMVKNWKYVKENWWLLPLAILALGWMLKNRGYKDAPAILTFGGALLVQAYRQHQDEEAKKKSTTSPTSQASGQTAGLDTGALPAGSYAWLQDPYGRWVKVSLPAALPQYAQSFRGLPAASNTNTGGPTQEDYEAAQQLAAAAFAAA